MTRPDADPSTPTAPSLDGDAVLARLEATQRKLDAVQAALTESQRLATLGTMAAFVAHEFNNILTPVLGYARHAVSQGGDDVARLRKAVVHALEGAERASRISTAILDFACASVEEASADVAEAVERSLRCMARDPEKDGITLELDIPPARAGIAPVALQQVLLNLILNARQAMRRRGGVIRVATELDRGRVQIVVADTGPGVPLAVRDRLFEAFVTAPTDDSSLPHKGTGLGLSVCKTLIEQAGGTIRVESEPGQGAAFHIDLPAIAHH